MKTKLRVWWVPQLGVDAKFYVDVPTVAEGYRLLETLAFYDLFQLKYTIKPDFCNAGGLEMFDPDCGWCDWKSSKGLEVDDYYENNEPMNAFSKKLYKQLGGRRG